MAIDAGQAPSWPEDAVEVGRILGAWGIKGGFKVAPFAADPQALIGARQWFLKPAETARPGSRSATAAAPARSSRTPAQQAALAAPLPVALNVRGVRDQGDAIVALAPEVADRDAAEALKGARVFISRASFPAPGDDEFYWIDLIGCSVANREGVTLGEVVGLIDTGPHCVLRIQPGAAETAARPDAEERLVPFVDAYVDQVDLAAKRIVVDWGLDY